MEIDTSCADLYDDWLHDEPGEDATDDASWSDSAESTTDTELDDLGLSCPSCSEVEKAMVVKMWPRRRAPAVVCSAQRTMHQPADVSLTPVRFQEIAEIIDIDIGMDVKHEQASISRSKTHRV